MDPLVHHLDQPTDQATEQTNHTRASVLLAPPRACAFFYPLCSTRSDRADEAPIEPTDTVSTVPSWLSHFFVIAQSFYYIISHFGMTNLVILLL
jgi:hypothetical protein